MAAYGPEITAQTPLNSYSLVKSLVGVLTLMAIAEGRLDSRDTRLPEVLGPGWPDVSVGALLTMTSGLSLRGEPPKDEKQLPLDDAEFSLLSPVARLHAFGVEQLRPRLVSDPQRIGQFHYQSVNTALLGRVLETVYAQPLEHLLARKIWQPAGAGEARWRVTPGSGRVSAYCCLYARAEDWLRVGRFLLDNGREDHPLLPEVLWQDWVQPQLVPEARRAGAYGWQIRHDVLDRPGAGVHGPFAYMAGHRGQRVYLLPAQDTVVVRFGAEPQVLHSTLYELLAPG